MTEGEREAEWNKAVAFYRLGRMGKDKLLALGARL